MTKQLIAIAFAAAFGIAHAADVKPAAAEVKPAVAAPEVKKEEAKPVKTAKKVVKHAEPKATPEAAKLEAPKAAEPAKK